MKKNFKKEIVVCCLLLFITILSGCSSSSSSSSEKNNSIEGGSVNSNNNESKLKTIYDLYILSNSDEISIIDLNVGKAVDFLEKQNLVIRYDVGNEYPYKKFPQPDYEPGTSETVFVDKGDHQYTNVEFKGVNNKKEDISLSDMLIWSFSFGNRFDLKIKIDNVVIGSKDKITPEEIDEKLKDLDCEIKDIKRNDGSINYKSITLATKDYGKAEILIFFEDDAKSISTISYGIYDYFASVKK